MAAALGLVVLSIGVLLLWSAITNQSAIGELKATIGLES